jgi:hypothetical protein
MNYIPYFLPNYDTAQTEKLMILSLTEAVTCKSTGGSLAILIFFKHDPRNTWQLDTTIQILFL